MLNVAVNMSSTGPIRAAIGDGVLTFMWMFCASAAGMAALLMESSIGVVGTGNWLLPYVVLTAVIFILILVFNALAEAFGGASFNPTGNASMYAAGLPGDSLLSMALRFPAQAAGAVAGSIAIKEVMPKQYKHMLGGPSLKVDVHTGAIAEGVLTFLISLVVLIVVIRVRGALLFKTWLLSVATVVLVVVGSTYTGPSMNPANAFGWAYINNQHNTWEHFYVYWICPFIGATLAAVVFKVLFPPPTKMQEKKPKKVD